MPAYAGEPSAFEEKRVSNQRLKTSGFEFLYPTYVEGLAALASGGIDPFTPELLEVARS